MIYMEVLTLTKVLILAPILEDSEGSDSALLIEEVEEAISEDSPSKELNKSSEMSLVKILLHLAVTGNSR